MTRIAGILAVALLVVGSACGAGETRAEEGHTTLERYGIAVTLPSGWIGRLTRGTVEATTRPVIPAGNDVRLDEGDLLVRLFEYEPEAGFLVETRQTHPDGAPGAFTRAEFGAPELGGDNPNGHGFARRNFSVAGRYFDLFVESGSAKPLDDSVAALNELVGSLEVRGGDFYPGTIEPPRFSSATGWYAGSFGGGEVRASDFASAWASTVPYRNGPRDLPPAATLETLPPDGILIWAGLTRDNRFPPTREVRTTRKVSVPLHVEQTRGGPGWEGQVREISLYRLVGRVDEQYDVDLWMFYGRAEPTADQREQAQAALNRLVLPEWGPWDVDGQAAVESERR